MSVEYDTDQKVFYFECPNCHFLTSVPSNSINCQIFRHGVVKKDGKQIPPHLSKEECDRLVREDLIYGCGKPFRFDGKRVEKCDYI